MCIRDSPDNLEVARQDPMAPVGLVDRLALANVDALVASACVQMPSLPAVASIQAKTGVPTLSAAVATAYSMMKELGLDTRVPGYGELFG